MPLLFHDLSCLLCLSSKRLNKSLCGRAICYRGYVRGKRRQRIVFRSYQKQCSKCNVCLPLISLVPALGFNALSNHGRELLIPFKERFNRGFEVPMKFSHKDKTYKLRMIILFEHGLRALKQKALQNRIQKTRDDFQELSGKLNR